jgi:predicted nucleotide-binding protein (sugar kinase/HSP70/actin superfamily)
MVITFPHLGSMYVFCKAIAETAGIPYVLPPPTSDRTREIGEFHTNESVCLPLKIILGNFIEALEAGADTIVMVGSGPPCRLGLYDRTIKIILDDQGYKYRWLTIPGIFNFQTFLQNHDETKVLKKELSPANIAKFPKAILMGWRKMRWCEYLEKAAARKRAVARFPLLVDQAYNRAMAAIDEVKTLRALSRAGKSAIKEIAKIEETGIAPLRVMMVGEVYTVMEPTINLNIEKRLGYNGVEIHRSSYFSTHIRRGSRLDRAVIRQRRKLMQLADPYLKYDVGAECNFSVAETIQAADRGFDGVVHVYPFSCMPETNAATVLASVATDYQIPLLGLALDRKDMGLRIDTQIEAFVDIMKWSKNYGQPPGC